MVVMKRLVVYIIFLTSSFSIFGQQEVFFTQANDFYNKGDYGKAIDFYQNIIKEGQHSTELYFNLANAYYKTQQVGPSIYYYEKALELAPNDVDVINNYAFAKQTRIDGNIDALPKGFLVQFYETLMGYSVDFWGYAAIVGVFLFVIGFILFYISSDVSSRKLLFGVWVLGLLVGLTSFILALSAQSYQKNHTYGVLFANEVNVQSEPNLRSEKLFKLHEGTKVQILEIIDGWSKIELVDGKLGWINSKQLKKL